MSDRWDPEMRVARERMDAAAAKLPPVLMTEPFGPSRLINEQLSMMWGHGGPTMADSKDHWLAIRGRRVQCRVHRPRTDRKLPVLVWFHGGGWVFASIDTHDRLVREYAAGAEIATVSVDYALAPETRFPGAVLECAEVVRALAGTEWGIDASRIVLGGDSAGGNLAHTTALALRDTGGPKLRGILTLYPVTSADFQSPSYREFAEGFGLTATGMEAYWHLYARERSDWLNPLCAPLCGDQAGMPPTLIQMAELDVLYSDGQRMAEKMRAAGVDVTFESYKGMLHGFMRMMDTVSAARTALGKANAWLRKVTA